MTKMTEWTQEVYDQTESYEKDIDDSVDMQSETTELRVPLVIALAINIAALGVCRAIDNLADEVSELRRPID